MKILSLFLILSFHSKAGEIFDEIACEFKIKESPSSTQSFYNALHLVALKVKNYKIKNLKQVADFFEEDYPLDRYSYKPSFRNYFQDMANLSLTDYVKLNENGDKNLGKLIAFITDKHNIGNHIDFMLGIRMKTGFILKNFQSMMKKPDATYFNAIEEITKRLIVLESLKYIAENAFGGQPSLKGISEDTDQKFLNKIYSHIFENSQL